MFFFFFKQKTAYEIRKGDWSSDVCSSDLWDIAGKHFNAPVYQLLGGATRDRIRVYAHWGIRDLGEEALAKARDRLDMLMKKGNYNAFKAGPAGKWRAHEPPSRIDQFVKAAYMIR